MRRTRDLCNIGYPCFLTFYGPSRALRDSAVHVFLIWLIFNHKFMRQRAYVEILSTREVWKVRKRRKRRSRVQL